MKKGDLIGYLNMDQEIEYGVIVTEEPYTYKSEFDDAYVVVDVAWLSDDTHGCDSTTKEPISNITSDSDGYKYIWLQSSLPVL